MYSEEEIKRYEDIAKQNTSVSQQKEMEAHAKTLQVMRKKIEQANAPLQGTELVGKSGPPTIFKAFESESELMSKEEIVKNLLEPKKEEKIPEKEFQNLTNKFGTGKTQAKANYWRNYSAFEEIKTSPEIPQQVKMKLLLDSQQELLKLYNRDKTKYVQNEKQKINEVLNFINSGGLVGSEKISKATLNDLEDIIKEYMTQEETKIDVPITFISLTTAQRIAIENILKKDMAYEDKYEEINKIIPADKLKEAVEINSFGKTQLQKDLQDLFGINSPYNISIKGQKKQKVKKAKQVGIGGMNLTSGQKEKITKIVESSTDITTDDEKKEVVKKLKKYVLEEKYKGERQPQKNPLLLLMESPSLDDTTKTIIAELYDLDIKKK